MTWQGQPIANGWEYTDSESGAKIILDHLHPTSRGLEAWVELRVNGAPNPVSFGRKDLMAPTSAAVFEKEASKKAGKVNWAEGLDVAFYSAISADREGGETVDLAEIEPGPIEWLLYPFVEKGGHTRIIAPGGSGKSYFALACGLAVATGHPGYVGVKPTAEPGPILYLDWETEETTHARRLRALCAGASQPLPSKGLIIYQNHSRPLHRSADQVHRIVDKFGVVMVVVDSVMLARGAGGQERAEDSTLRMFEALRAFTVPALLIDHKSKEDMAKKRRGGYGSIVNENAVRSQWEMTRLTPLTKQKRAFVLTHEKHNNTSKHTPMGYQFTVVEESTRDGTWAKLAVFERVSSSELTDTMTDVADRIVSLMLGGSEPMPVRKITEMLGNVSEGTVRARLNQDARFVNVSPNMSKKGLWDLADREGMHLEMATDETDEPDVPATSPPAVENGWTGEVY